MGARVVGLELQDRVKRLISCVFRYTIALL